jgi:hypothetical protein
MVFLKKSALLIKGINFACNYPEGKVRMSEEHRYYF